MEEIKILGCTYRLKRVDAISREEFRIGEIDYVNQEIKIINSLHHDIETVTIIHEILHGILNQLGFDEATDEHLIQSLATSLFQVFACNPSLSARFSD